VTLALGITVVTSITILGRQNAKIATLNAQVTGQSRRLAQLDSAQAGAFQEAGKLQQEINLIGVPCDSMRTCLMQQPKACQGALACLVMDAKPGPAWHGYVIPPYDGQVIVDAPGTRLTTPWLVTDYTGAPMAWVNLFGLYSGGDGGKMAGGELGVTYGTKYVIAKLTPEGTLVLQPTGPSGPTGPPVTLTAADIEWLHRHGG